MELAESEIRKLRKLHRQLRNEGDAKSADRIKTIISLARGYSYSEVAEILLLDETTIREYAKKYKKGGIDGLLAYYYKPYEGFLYDDEIEILCKELDSKICLDAKAVCAFILETFDVEYSERVWKLMKKVVRGNFFIATYKEFRNEILKFFIELPSRFSNELETLLSENFQIIELST